MASVSENSQCILAMLLSAAVVTVSDMSMREVTRLLPISEALTLRGVIVSTMIGVLALSVARSGVMAHAIRPAVIARAVAESAMAVFYFSALPHMIFAEVTAVFLSSSLMAAALAAMLGFERVRLGNWAVLFLGFVGVAIVLRPSFGRIEIGAVLVLAAAFMLAVRDVITRRVDPRIPTVVITWITSMMVTLVGLCLAPFDASWRSPAGAELALLLAAGVLVGGANFLGVLAYRKGDISVIGPFRYAILPFSIVGAYFAWRELPNFWSVIGGAIIVACGIVALWMQRPSRGR
jgi:drug/metabolite transporter (DMT)-like permease